MKCKRNQDRGWNHNTQCSDDVPKAEVCCEAECLLQITTYILNENSSD